MANSPLIGLKIDIINARKDFDEFIKYMNTVASKPINIQLNVNQVQQQIQQINTEFIKLNQALKLNGSNNGVLDSFTTITKEVAGQLQNTYQTISKGKNDLNQTVQILETINKNSGDIESRVTKTTEDYKKEREEAEKLAEAMAKGREQAELKTKAEFESSQLKQAQASNKGLEQEYQEQQKIQDAIEKTIAEREKNNKLLEENQAKAVNQALDEEYNNNLKLVDAMAKVNEQSIANSNKRENNLDINQEKAILENQNISYKEAVDLLNQKYKIQNDINIAEQKEYTNVLELLKVKQEEINTSLQGKVSELSDENLYNLKLKENELIQQQAVNETKVNDIERLHTAEIEKQIQLIQDKYAIALQNLQTKYGSLTEKGNIATQIDDFKFSLDNLDETNFNKGEIANQFKQIEANVKSSSSALRLANQDAKSFGETALADATKFGMWMIIGTAIMQPIRAIEDGIKSVKELDDTVNDLSMDMMSTSQVAFSNLIDKSRELSIQIGTNVTDIDTMMKVYSNANTSTEEIMQKVKSASILTNISDMSAKDSVDAIQSIIMQFNQFSKSEDSLATQSQHVSDVLASVAQNLNLDFKTGISNISEAIKVSGEVINEAGMSYEKYAAIVGKVTEISRLSGDTVGNAMKTIASRISRANSGDVSADEISAIDKAYQSIGIHIRDDSGNFKDLDTNLTSLSNVWNNLNSVQRSYIAEQSAGVKFCSPK